MGADVIKSKSKGAACDLQHLLIFADNFNMLGLTGGKRLLAKSYMASL
jgi:hypothetical protein